MQHLDVVGNYIFNIEIFVRYLAGRVRLRVRRGNLVGERNEGMVNNGE